MTGLGNESEIVAVALAFPDALRLIRRRLDLGSLTGGYKAILLALAAVLDRADQPDLLLGVDLDAVSAELHARGWDAKYDVRLDDLRRLADLGVEHEVPWVADALVDALLEARVRGRLDSIARRLLVLARDESVNPRAEVQRLADELAAVGMEA